MNCNKIRDIIATDYIDHELDVSTQNAIDAHLDHCAACRAYKEALLTLAVNPLRRLEVMEPPEALWFKIREALTREKQDNETIDIGAALAVFHRRWLNTALVIIMLLCTILAGHYCVTNILSSGAKYPAQATVEFTNNLELTEFSDIPNEQAKTVYANMIGG